MNFQFKNIFEFIHLPKEWNLGQIWWAIMSTKLMNSPMHNNSSKSGTQPPVRDPTCTPRLNTFSKPSSKTIICKTGRAWKFPCLHFLWTERIEYKIVSNCGFPSSRIWVYMLIQIIICMSCDSKYKFGSKRSYFLPPELNIFLDQRVFQRKKGFSNEYYQNKIMFLLHLLNSRLLQQLCQEKQSHGRLY